MADVGVRELRQNLSKYLARVKAGESLTVTEHGREVAYLTPSAGYADAARFLVEELGATPAEGSLRDYLRERGLPAPAPSGSPSSGAILDDLRGERP